MIIVQRGIPARPGEGKSKVLIEMTEKEAGQLMMAIHSDMNRRWSRFQDKSVMACWHCFHILQDLFRTMGEEGITEQCKSIEEVK